MIHVVDGEGAGPTEKAAFDAALAAAGLHQYNLRRLSSVIPAGTTVEVVGTAPDLGPTGAVLDVVLADQVGQPGTGVAAGLAWARDPSGGVFYEVGGTDAERVTEQLHAGVEHGMELRGVDGPVETRVVTAEAGERHVAAVVAAVYGEGSRLL